MTKGYIGPSGPDIPGHLFVLGRDDGQEKKNQEAKAMARACISRVRKYIRFTRDTGKTGDRAHDGGAARRAAFSSTRTLRATPPPTS
jgi:hypothetical protein